jgi:tripartite-type tricarboxylate transporter receptor subunit TctC
MGLWVKPDVPAPVQARLRETALKALAQPALRARLLELGFEPGQPRTTEELTKSLRADSDRMAAMLKAIGYKPE